MMWIAAIVLALVFVKLGMLIVLVKVLVVGLIGALAVSLLLSIALLWRKLMSIRAR